MRTSPVSRRAFAAGSASVAVSLIMPTMVAGKVPRPTAPPSEATGETTLRSLLAITLDFKGKDSAVPRETRFSNLLTHYNHFGLAPLKSSNEPTDPRIPTIFQIGGVPQDSSFISTEPEHWLELFGFHPFTIQAMLDQGPLDDYFLLVQGVFDQEAVFAAWERTGYAPSEGSSNIWQLNLDDGSRFDLAFGIGFFGFLGGSYDYASFLDEKTVVLASDPYYIEQAQDALNGLIESLLDSPTVGSLTQSMPSDSCRAFILKDRAFNEEVTSTNPNLSPAQREEVRSELEAIEAQHGPMPGIVAGI